MRRRLFLSSSSAAVAFVLTGCGGGGGGSSTASGAAGTPAAGAAAAGLDLPVSVATPTPVAAATAQPQAAVPATGYPFGSRLNRYVAGIRPSQSNETMDALLTKQYDAWKAANVVKADSVVAGGYAVQFTNRTYMTVSEGMGYGMLLAVLFHGHDPQAQQLFDGLLAVVRARPAYGIVEQGHFASGKYLMDWRLNADGSSGGGGWNAMDGDLDIAMALLMADRQWGSTGKWNYLEEGKATINAMKDFNMRPDGTTKGLPGAGTSRTSDYMIGHFRAFQKATGDALWNTAIDRAYQLSDRMQTVYSAGVGLMPDFIVGTDTASPYPSPGGMGDGNMDEDKYWWNACRNPWRYSSDYLLSGDTRWKTITARMIDFFQKSSGGDPTQIGTGYTLAGAKAAGGNSGAYHGPVCAGACVDARFQGFLDTMWNWNAKNLTTGYYDSEIQLLSLVVASGNWWTTA
jgi:endoglucanase